LRNSENLLRGDASGLAGFELVESTVTMARSMEILLESAWDYTYIGW
jgi:hypothetical protein